MPQIDLWQVVSQGLLHLRVDRFGSLGLGDLCFIEQFVDLRITVTRPVLSVGGNGFGAVDEFEYIWTLISPHKSVEVELKVVVRQILGQFLPLQGQEV